MHLTPAQLVDVAEGTTSESAAPHLASCGACRRQVDDMRQALQAADRLDVPEPSPLFWEQLSARVSEAVANEGQPRRSWLDVASWPRLVMPACAAALAPMLIAIALVARTSGPQPPVTTARVSRPAAVESMHTNLDASGDITADDP